MLNGDKTGIMHFRPRMTQMEVAATVDGVYILESNDVFFGHYHGLGVVME